MRSTLMITAVVGLFGSVWCQSQTPDGSCGGTNKFLCNNPSFGDCCSSSGYCGSGIEYCGQGCQATFSNTTTSCLAKPPSINGSCGGSAGITCSGGPYDGSCCSKYGFCGKTASFCSTLGGCQAEFGAACTLP
ncbi:hypothetical protein BZA77DRAFT_385045 [Pyronema omphalodes]|nr:hypothetical protein BZA77DRAFT_385045 [Pyronema omphalodes]